MYKIGEVYDFGGTQRKVLGFDGEFPITSTNLDVLPSKIEQSEVKERVMELETLLAEKDDLIEELQSKLKEYEPKLSCKYCGKECASALGLSSHERNCKSKEE